MMALKMCPIPGDTYGLTDYSIMPQKAVSMGLERKENREGNVEKSPSLCRTELSLWFKKMTPRSVSLSPCSVRLREVLYFRNTF